MLRNILSNYCCGVHRACTNNPLKSDRRKKVDPSWDSVRSVLSTSLLWGRFRCSRTIHSWSKVIPDCDNSAVKRNFKWTTWRFLGWASSHFWKKLAGTSRWSAVISQALDRCLRWHLTYHASGAPCKHHVETRKTRTSNQKKFYICADGSHTRLAAARLLLRFASSEGYYPIPEAEMVSKYREESSIELILKLTGPRQVMPPCDVLGSTKSV